MIQRVCPKCGKSNREVSFYKNFCVNCFLKDHKEIVSVKDLEIELCPSCLRLSLGGRWCAPEKLKGFLHSTVKIDELKRVKVSLEEELCDEKECNYALVVVGFLGKERVTVRREIKVKFAKKQCGVCSKKQSEYHVVKLQLRSSSPLRLKKAFNIVRNESRAYVKKDRMAEVFRFNVMSDGIDIYLGSLKAAKQSIKALLSMSKGMKRTYKLKGFDRHKGKKAYITTIVIRI